MYIPSLGNSFAINYVFPTKCVFELLTLLERFLNTQTLYFRKLNTMPKLVYSPENLHCKTRLKCTNSA